MTTFNESAPRSAPIRIAAEILQKVYTTGQVATICKVAPRTVSKWFDSGRLKGYRIPDSQDRRIPAPHLFAFMLHHGIEQLIPREWIATGERVLYAWIPAEYPDAPNTEKLLRAESEFDAALWVNDPTNHKGVCVIGTANGYHAALRLAMRLKGISRDLRVVVVYTTADICDMATTDNLNGIAQIMCASPAEFNAKVLPLLEPLPVS